jgi:hypothetical protein
MQLPMPSFNKINGFKDISVSILVFVSVWHDLNAKCRWSIFFLMNKVVLMWHERTVNDKHHCLLSFFSSDVHKQPIYAGQGEREHFLSDNTEVFWARLQQDGSVDNLPVFLVDLCGHLCQEWNSAWHGESGPQHGLFLVLRSIPADLHAIPRCRNLHCYGQEVGE